MTTPREEAFTFDAAGEPLVGILHDPGLAAERAVVVVVGGPQYRTGAHRQYVLLARELAEAGTPVLRFDYRGMGDSGGSFRGFEDCGADIAAAIDALVARLPMVREVVLWGLCDGATAIAFYQAQNRDPRVVGAVLLNPWARSDRTLAETQVRHWYGKRLTSGAFWKKLMTGGVDVRAAAGGLIGTLATRFRSASPAAVAAAGGAAGSG
ncbi:hydrolase 1, exosortase A system-associated, partial [Caenispirillum bisanense]|uniref:hydrolase 1, exosortase A system-associated n=1 Tax=Caenispirillum bisanense TaxID=414052 RepID=UPI0031E29649